MKIVIIGAGAMGCLFGAYLARNNNEVILIDNNKELVEKINKSGIQIEEGNKTFNINLKAKTSSSELEGVNLVIIFVKSYFTEKAIIENKSLIKEDTLFLTLQNGVGNIEVLSKHIERKNIIAGTTTQGANVKDLAHVVHGGMGKTFIGSPYEASDKLIKKVIEIFNSSGINTFFEEDLDKLIWSKLIVNCGINALTSILKIKNGELLNYEESRFLIKKIVDESCRVAKKKKIYINNVEIMNKIEEVCIKTKDNISSMFQDIKNLRETEIEYINGVIVKEAEGLGIEVPYNKTLVSMVKILERDSYNKLNKVITKVDNI